MRRIRLLIIAVISFLFTLGSESFLKKFISLSLCSILSFNATCNTYLIGDSRVNAALPPLNANSTDTVAVDANNSEVTREISQNGTPEIKENPRLEKVADKKNITEEAFQRTLKFNTQIDQLFRNGLKSEKTIPELVKEITIILNKSSQEVKIGTIKSTVDGGIEWYTNEGINVVLSPDIYLSEMLTFGSKLMSSNSSDAGYKEKNKKNGISLEISKEFVAQVGNSDNRAPSTSGKKALVLSPYKFDLKERDPGIKVQEILTKSGFNVTFKENSSTSKLNLKDFAELDQYDVVFIDTHGSPGQISTGITTKTLTPFYKWEGLNVSTSNTLNITAEFIKKYSNLKRNALVYLDVCSNLSPDNNSIGQALREKGAAAVFGYTDLAPIKSEIPNKVLTQLLDCQVTGNIPELNQYVPDERSFWKRKLDKQKWGKLILLGDSNFSLCAKPDKRSGNLKKGTSYGDPHLITFDGYRYSFQTVGEFILAKSTDGTFEVQTRQSAVNKSLSLNSAVAMKVGNNRVAFYSKDLPDSNTNTPLRINGKPAVVQGNSLSLQGGGKIYKQSDTNYVVEWPTGEKVALTIYSRGQFQYMDVFPLVFESQANQMVGLLGNVNGDAKDDLRFRSGNVLPSKSTYGDVRQLFERVSPIKLPLGQLEKVYFDKLNKDFGNDWRVSKEESLFDYPSSKSTETFMDKAFPDAYLTLDMLSPTQLQQARTQCQNAGVEASLLEGCLFDVGFTGYSEFASRAAQVTNILNLFESVIPGFKNPVPGILRRIPKIPGIRF